MELQYSGPGTNYVAEIARGAYDQVASGEPSCTVAGLPQAARGDDRVSGDVVEAPVLGQAGTAFGFRCFCNVANTMFGICEVSKRLTKQTVLEYWVTDDRKNKPETWIDVASGTENFITDNITVLSD